jgi:hypothetical protein
MSNPQSQGQEMRCMVFQSCLTFLSNHQSTYQYSHYITIDVDAMSLNNQ